ncbi:hypothetical protein T4D_5245 [Trichinella pseudospiralis]|uniref:Uncharacterized protein n=1 Tax=Trichinella pseudospiralis TaxID=6337 RepID=A0A0V1FS89_TRIPS|nr:hypothetical protein T4D_5245 [Trichinella pseudospiralis]
MSAALNHRIYRMKDSSMPPVDNVKEPENFGSLLELIVNSKTIAVVNGHRIELNKINDYLLSVDSKPCQIADIKSISVFVKPV